MGVQRFEDLRVWQLARSFCADIGAVTSDGPFSRDFALRAQINDAAASCMSNIAEGFLRRSRKDFAQFIRIAAGSNGEARSILYAARDRSYLSETEFVTLIEKSNDIGKMLCRLESYLRYDGRPRARPHR